MGQVNIEVESAAGSLQQRVARLDRTPLQGGGVCGSDVAWSGGEGHRQPRPTRTALQLQPSAAATTTGI